MKNWKGLSAERRQGDRRQRLLDTAFSILGEGGAKALSVRAVCRQSGVTERYFYQIFGSRDDLLAKVFRSIAEEMVVAGECSVLGLEESSRHDRLRAHVDGMVAFFEADPRRGRIIFRESLNEPASIAQAIESAGTIFSRLLGAAGPEVKNVSAATVFGATGSGFTLLVWLEGHLDVDRSALVETITESLLRVLDPH